MIAAEDTLLPVAPRTWRSTPALSDAELIAACLDGSQAAWDEMVERFGRLVYSIPRRHGFSDPDAEDVFQSVFSILYQKLGTIREAGRLAPWLIRTTHRVCYRIGKHSPRHADLDGVIQDVSAPDQEDADAWEQRHLVHNALRRLGGLCQRLLTALFLAPGPPSYEVIARDLGMKAGSIGPTRARCFLKLEKILAELGVGPPERAGTRR
jgi:RNA polymerase sigma factor (sigma-70 family)